MSTLALAMALRDSPGPRATHTNKKSRRLVPRLEHMLSPTICLAQPFRRRYRIASQPAGAVGVRPSLPLSGNLRSE